MKIVLTGSLGHIGKPLTQKLVEKGHSVTVISSNPAKKADIEASGAQAAIGSVGDVNFLTDAFTASDAVYCMVPPDFGQADQVLYYQNLGNTYANAIRKAGVKRIVHLSSYGAHLSSGTGFITGSYQVEQLLNAIANVHVTHVRPTFFYYNLLHFVEMIKTAHFIGAVYGGTDKLSMVSPTDIAVVIAEELQIGEGANLVRYVASDDRTCNEIASVLGKAIGMPNLKWLVLSKENVLQALKEAGMPSNAADNLVELGEAIHSGKLREDYGLHTPVYGTVKLEAYAVEFARIFKAK
jgi:uncharacterized protein YbjT (DUF2867 family)